MEFGVYKPHVHRVSAPEVISLRKLIPYRSTRHALGIAVPRYCWGGGGVEVKESFLLAPALVVEVSRGPLGLHHGSYGLLG